MFPGVHDVSRLSGPGLDSDQHVGLECDRLTRAGRFGAVAIRRERPRSGLAAVIEDRLTDQVDLHAAL